MKRIGILGGLGPESTITYYAHITRTYYERFGDYAYPEIIIYSLRFADYIGSSYQMVGEFRSAIAALARAGADFAVAACNTIHLIYDEVVKDIPIPWFSMVDSVAQRVREHNLRKLALLGTVYTMGGDFYQKGFARYELEVLTPDQDAQKQINRIIYDELVLADIRDESREIALGIVEELRKQGAEGIILGCTELPFLITGEHTDLPIFDTTTIHAEKALDLALDD